jgi:predicted HTH transcriptional regulator
MKKNPTVRGGTCIFIPVEHSGQKYLRTLISGGENQELDFKFEISDARKIARTLSAFSNTDGGRLLIGVKDNGRISGVRSEEEYYMVESAASLFSKPEVRFESRQHLIEGKNVLEIYVPPAGQKPVYAKDEENRWKAYIRVKDQNILAGIVQLQVWKEERRKRGKLLEYTRREEILLETLSKNQGITLSKIQRDTGFPRKELISLLTKLVLFDVLNMQFKEGQNRFWLKEKPGE